MTRIVQISDSHVSPRKSHFADNWAPLAAWIAAECPDLVIHTGDLTIDGADDEEDLRYCARLMREVGVRFRALPGNHDVGDAGHKHQPVNRERLARWQRHFGPDRWVEDVEGWRLIGFDAMLIGSGEPEELAQLRWLEAVMGDAGGSKLAWFLHRPLFLEHPEEGDTGYWSVKPEPRRGLLRLVRHYRSRSSPADTCTRRTILPATAPDTSGRRLRRFCAGRRCRRQCRARSGSARSATR